MLDGNPHGLVHTMIGTSTNMGRVPFAANDPIFWLHHCTLDRVWEGWNRAGHANPAWPTNRQLSFASAQGTAVNRLPADANRTASLGYQYDTDAAAPTAPGNLRLVVEASRPVPRAATGEPTVLRASRTRVSLAPARGTAAHRHPVAEEDSSGGRLYLLFGGLSAPADASSTYNVFLDLSDAARTPGPDSPHYLGTLDFFSAMGPQGHVHDGRRLPFNITGKLDGLATDWQANHTLTFVRHGDEESEPPAIAEVVLVEA
jgi:tyrosinase